jgi:basic membrane protein A and related proteins
MKRKASGSKNNWLAGLLVVLMILVMADTGMTQEKTRRPKAALLLGQGINDAGFGAAGYLGLQALREKLGFETTLVENLGSPDFDAACRDFASRGWDIVFGHGFEFQDPFLRVAPDFPNTKFVVNKGAPRPTTPPNLLIVDIKEHEPAYILGVIAAHLTKSSKVGGIAGADYGTIIRIMEAYRAGARSVKPDIRVFITYTGTWIDPAKGKEAALAQIGQGADVVFAHASLTSLGVFGAAQEKGVLSFGSVLDQNQVAPSTVVVGSLYDFPKLFEDIGKQVKEKSFKGGSVSVGMAAGVLDITPLYGAAQNLSPLVKDQIEKLRTSIKQGSFTVQEVRKKSE